MDEDCQYTALPDGGWEWPLWEWKGTILKESECAYGKFFNKKAGFVSREWWPDFCNYRRSRNPRPEEGSIEDMILRILQESGSLITRQLRAECGFTGSRMRSKFDAFLTNLEMGCYIVTKDFVYPQDRPHRKRCSARRPVVLTVHRKSPDNGYWHTSDRYCPTHRKRYATACWDKPEKANLIFSKLTGSRG